MAILTFYGNYLARPHSVELPLLAYAMIIYGSGLITAAAAVVADVPSVATNPADALTEWIRLNRRATSTPGPTSTATISPAPVPKLAAAPASLFGSVLPSLQSLRDTALPLLIYAMFIALAVFLVRRGDAGARLNGPIGVAER